MGRIYQCQFSKKKCIKKTQKRTSHEKLPICYSDENYQWKRVITGGIVLEMYSEVSGKAEL